MGSMSFGDALFYMYSAELHQAIRNMIYIDERFLRSVILGDAIQPLLPLTITGLQTTVPSLCTIVPGIQYKKIRYSESVKVFQICTCKGTNKPPVVTSQPLHPGACP